MRIKAEEIELAQAPQDIIRLLNEEGTMFSNKLGSSSTQLLEDQLMEDHPVVGGISEKEIS